MVECSRHSLCASHVSQHAIQKQVCVFAMLLCLESGSFGTNQRHRGS